MAQVEDLFAADEAGTKTDVGEESEVNRMDEEQILARVKKIIEAELGRKEEEVTPSSSFTEDLGADSLDVVQVVMALEDEFGIDIPDEDVEAMRTVQNAVDYIKSKAGEGAAQ